MTTVRELSPLACAVRMWSELRTSSIPVRVSRAMYAAKTSPRQKPGRIMCLIVPQPATGKTGTRNTKRITRKLAMTKFGSAMPAVAATRRPRSTPEPGLSADAMPAETPRASANIIDTMPSNIDFGRLCARMSLTVKSL